MALPMVYGGPGRYVQGPGELSRQGRYLSWLGCAAYVLFDQGTEDRLCRQIVDGFLDEDLSEPFFKIYDGPCTEEAVVEMAKEARAEYCDMVVGIGGGKMLDIAKAVAFYAELPLCVCPTAASMDGPCSAISVLYHEDG
ncbi:MAG: iron-containing alcohol dehydrogenase, partial [Collinsella sp.]|nr:iron-containing alcohol dehydrogenase [Collinsella sp.]